MEQATDAELVERARAADRAAAGELVRRHWRAAWQRGFAITGRAAMAEDVAQESLVAALDRLETLDDPTVFGAWVSRIASRRALDALRVERRLVALEPSHEIAIEWEGDAGDAHDLRAAVAALPPDRRAVVVMRFWLDLRPSEIAEALEIPVGTVNSRIARALAELREAEGAFYA